MSKTLRRVGQKGAVSVVLENVRRKLVAMERESADLFYSFEGTVALESGACCMPARLDLDPDYDCDGTPETSEEFDRRRAHEQAELAGLGNMTLDEAMAPSQPLPVPELVACYCGLGHARCHHQEAPEREAFLTGRLEPPAT